MAGAQLPTQINQHDTNLIDEVKEVTFTTSRICGNLIVSDFAE